MSKTYEFILASSNAHKASELQELFILFGGENFKILAANEQLEVEETGLSYNENAFLKASSYYKKFKRPTLADDSGLTVTALADELGLYSARFGGEGLSDSQRCQLLLKKLENFKEKEERHAYFTCCLCLYFSPEEVFFFEGRVLGSIGHELKGEGGFGYDPLFIPQNYDDKSSLAEILDWKNQNSHRALAVKAACAFLTGQKRIGNCQKA